MVIPSLEVDSVGIVARRGPLAVHSGGGALSSAPPPAALRFASVGAPPGLAVYFPPATKSALRALGRP